MKVTVDLHGWADSLTGGQKVVFVLQLALANSGYGFGYDIKFTHNSIDGSHLVYKPWEMDVIATTVTSRHYDLVKDVVKGETKDVHRFKFIAKQYSLPEIYLGAIKKLGNSKEAQGGQAK